MKLIDLVNQVQESEEIYWTPDPNDPDESVARADKVLGKQVAIGTVEGDEDDGTLEVRAKIVPVGSRDSVEGHPGLGMRNSMGFTWRAIENGPVVWYYDPSPLMKGMVDDWLASHFFRFNGDHVTGIEDLPRSEFLKYLKWMHGVKESEEVPAKAVVEALLGT